MKEFEALVRRVHAEKMKILIDFVPNHTARVYHSDSSPAGVEDFGTQDNINMNFAPDNNYYYISNQRFYPSFDISGGENHTWNFPQKPPEMIVSRHSVANMTGMRL